MSDGTHLARLTSAGSHFAVALVFVLSVTAVAAQGATLIDAQIYFDPDSIAPDFYSEIELSDLSADNTATWDADANPVIDADILPTLKAGVYGDGYVFSQSDYLATPNVDYSADITTGALSVTFDRPGLYHVRTTRQSGAEEVFAVFAQTGFAKKNGSPDKSGANKSISIPSADLHLVENSDSILQNAADNLAGDGQTVERVDSRQDVIDKIIAKSNALGRKIHVEISGHGAPGVVSTGAGVDDVPDKQIDATSVAAFQQAIDAYVDNLTFFASCSVAKDQAGKDFLQILADSIGTASAWDSPVSVSGGFLFWDGSFSVNVGANYVTVTPEPSTGLLVAIGLGLMAVVRRTRRSSTVGPGMILK